MSRDDDMLSRGRDRDTRTTQKSIVPGVNYSAWEWNFFAFQAAPARVGLSAAG